MIVDQTKFKLIPIDKCIKAEWNYKEENEFLTDKLVANIKRNGQIENLLVRELDTGFYEVVNGNHRFDALKKLEAKSVMAFDLGKITDAQAYRIAVETNETKFASDEIKLADLLKEMGSAFTVEELAQTLPYNEVQLDNFLKMADFDWSKFDEEQETKRATTHQSKSDKLMFAADTELLAQWEAWAEVCEQHHPDCDNMESQLSKAITLALNSKEHSAK